jgi:hypothetical protein
MRIISHRGNLQGKNPERENHPDYIKESLAAGFECEVDIWYVDKEFYLGHDKPSYKIDEYKTFEYSEILKLWFHCKDIVTLYQLLYSGCDGYVFLHNLDDCAIAINSEQWSYLWTYPSKSLTNRSIAVLPEWDLNWDIHEAHGVCTDFPLKYDEIYNK